MVFEKTMPVLVLNDDKKDEYAGEYFAHEQ
jgi:hypothetical protein